MLAQLHMEAGHPYNVKSRSKHVVAPVAGFFQQKLQQEQILLADILQLLKATPDRIVFKLPGQPQLSHAICSNSKVLDPVCANEVSMKSCLILQKESCGANVPSHLPIMLALLLIRLIMLRKPALPTSAHQHIPSRIWPPN